MHTRDAMMRYRGNPKIQLATAAGVLLLAAAAFRFFKRGTAGAKASTAPDSESLTESSSYEPIRSGRDHVDEASWESFPASDPPGNY